MKLKLDRRTIAFIVIFIIGLSILLYPLISSTWNQMIANRVISKYDDTVAAQSPETINELLEAARQYNDKMVPKAVPDAFTIRNGVFDAEYESLVNISGNGLMGYIDIPVIDVHAPIYHYTIDEVLQKGVGHLFGSSLPVGGKGSHSVLSAHRGVPSNKLFSDLDKIVEGDKFFIHVLDEVLAYQVDKIEIVEPDQTQGLALFNGEDYITLVTCTPYGVNTHRLLCRGHRIPYNPTDEKVPKRLWLNMNIMTSLIGALLGILIALILAIRMKKRKKDDSEQGTEEKQEKKDPKIRFRRVK